MEWLGETLRERGPVLILLSLALALTLSALAGEQGLMQVRELDRQLAETENRNFELVQSIARVRDEVRAIRTDDQVLEQVARLKGNLVRPGETLYRLPPPGRPAARENGEFELSRETVAP